MKNCKTGKCQTCEKEADIYLSTDFKRSYYVCADCQSKLSDWRDWRMYMYGRGKKIVYRDVILD